MKKLFMILIAILTILTIIGCGTKKNKTVNDNIEIIQIEENVNQNNIKENSTIKNQKIYEELGQIYNGSDILKLFYKYNELGCVFLVKTSFSDSKSFTRSILYEKDNENQISEKMIKIVMEQLSEFFNNKSIYEIFLYSR